MKNLKFRVWDKNNKRWYSEELFLNKEGMILDSNHEQVDGEIDFYMGYTDKNGVEIYNSSIVEFQNNEGENVCRKMSFFDDLAFFGKYNITKLDFCTVIGNTFESKDLLETL